MSPEAAGGLLWSSDRRVPATPLCDPDESLLSSPLRADGGPVPDPLPAVLRGHISLEGARVESPKSGFEPFSGAGLASNYFGLPSCSSPAPVSPNVLDAHPAVPQLRPIPPAQLQPTFPLHAPATLGALNLQRLAPITGLVESQDPGVSDLYAPLDLALTSTSCPQRLPQDSQNSWQNFSPSHFPRHPNKTNRTVATSSGQTGDHLSGENSCCQHNHLANGLKTGEHPRLTDCSIREKLPEEMGSLDVTSAIGNEQEPNTSHLMAASSGLADKLLPEALTSRMISLLMNADPSTEPKSQDILENWRQFHQAALANNIDPNVLLLRDSE
ncbi:unnamed protein product [Protopolystoma xenopodis]|uniref:Uncharacterized protein n=1 Tax=Protopolystoma xenopodis TaxID=117903 RepID=A0A3S5CDC8_9PLAT|nr:unnamed protein product [Protopolystoma xenopodis]